MNKISNVVITRSKIYGKNKNVGGLETYLKAFCEVGSKNRKILLICGSGNYIFYNGASEKIKSGFSSKNQYLLTIYIGFRALFYILRNQSLKIHVFSFGLSGIFISIIKSLGFFDRINLGVILFGLEFMIQSKESNKLFTRIQHKIGLRKFLGYLALRHSDKFFTEYPNHINEYLKHFPFLKEKENVCIPDPIDVPNHKDVNHSVSRKYQRLREKKEILIISIGRDSPDKRRDLSIKFFQTLANEFAETSYKLNFKICVPKKSETLCKLTESIKNIEICEGLSDEELVRLRQDAIFCISHSNQNVPLLSILEDMSWQVIPISNDTLGQSLNNNCAVLIDDDISACKEIKELIKTGSLMQKSEHAFIQANKFGKTEFSNLIQKVFNNE